MGARLAVVMKLVQEKQWMKLGGHKIRQNHSVIAKPDSAVAEATHNSEQPGPPSCNELGKYQLTVCSG